MVITVVEYKTNVIYRTVGTNRTAGNLSCGFIHKPNEKGSNKDIIFEHYGGLLLLDGEGEYTDRFSRNIKLSKGAFVQRLPGLKHSTIIKPDGRWLEFFICISAESYHNLLTMGLMTDEPVVFCSEDTVNELLPFLSELLAKMKKAGEQELPELYFKAQQLLCLITSKCTRNKGDDDMIRTACKLIERYSGRISGEEVALQMHIGYETLRKRFKDAVGIPIGQYAIRVRINTAKSLIMRSGLPLDKLAVQLGYPDYFTFCKQFKQHTGITPAQFKQMN